MASTVTTDNTCVHTLIADDHTLFREGVRALLNAAPDLEVVGEAANGEDAIAQAAALLPDPHKPSPN